MAGAGAKIILMLFIVNSQGSKKPVVRDGSSWSTMKTAVKHGTDYRRGGKDGMSSMHRVDTADAADAENLDDLDSTQLKEKVKLQHAKLQEKDRHIAELQSAVVKARKTLQEKEGMIKQTDSALQLDNSARPRKRKQKQGTAAKGILDGIFSEDDAKKAVGKGISDGISDATKGAVGKGISTASEGIGKGAHVALIIGAVVFFIAWVGLYFYLKKNGIGESDDDDDEEEYDDDDNEDDEGPARVAHKDAQKRESETEDATTSVNVTVNTNGTKNS